MVSGSIGARCARLSQIASRTARHWEQVRNREQWERAVNREQAQGQPGSELHAVAGCWLTAAAAAGGTSSELAAPAGSQSASRSQPQFVASIRRAPPAADSGRMRCVTPRTFVDHATLRDSARVPLRREHVVEPNVRAPCWKRIPVADRVAACATRPRTARRASPESSRARCLGRSPTPLRESNPAFARPEAVRRAPAR